MYATNVRVLFREFIRFPSLHGINTQHSCSKTTEVHIIFPTHLSAIIRMHKIKHIIPYVYNILCINSLLEKRITPYQDSGILLLHTQRQNNYV